MGGRKRSSKRSSAKKGREVTHGKMMNGQFRNRQNVADITSNFNTCTIHFQNGKEETLCMSRYVKASKSMSKEWTNVKKVCVTRETLLILFNDGTLKSWVPGMDLGDFKMWPNSFRDLLLKIPHDVQDIIESDGLFGILRNGGEFIGVSMGAFCCEKVQNVKEMHATEQRLYLLRNDNSLAVFGRRGILGGSNDNDTEKISLKTSGIKSIHTNHRFRRDLNIVIVQYLDGSIEIEGCAKHSQLKVLFVYPVYTRSKKKHFNDCGNQHVIRDLRDEYSEADLDKGLNTFIRENIKNDVIQISINLCGCAILSSDNKVYSWTHYGEIFEPLENVRALGCTWSRFGVILNDRRQFVWGIALPFMKNSNSATELFDMNHGFLMRQSDNSVKPFIQVSPPTYFHAGVKMRKAVSHETGFLVLTDLDDVIVVGSQAETYHTMVGLKPGTFFPVTEKQLCYLDIDGNLYVSPAGWKGAESIASRKKTTNVIDIVAKENSYRVKYDNGTSETLRTDIKIFARNARVLDLKDVKSALDVDDGTLVLFRNGSTKYFEPQEKPTKNQMLFFNLLHHVKKIVPLASGIVYLYEDGSAVHYDTSKKPYGSKTSVDTAVEDIFPLGSKNVLIHLKTKEIRLFGFNSESISDVRRTNVQSVHVFEGGNRFGDFALLCYEDKTVAVHGYFDNDCLRNTVNQHLREKVSDFESVHCNDVACAVVYSGGRIVTWIHHGPNPILRTIDTTAAMILSTERAFLVLGHDGQLLSWCGEKSYDIPPSLHCAEIRQILATKDSFAALTTDGKVEFWGECPSFIPVSSKVAKMVATRTTFVFLLEDNSVVHRGTRIPRLCDQDPGVVLFSRKSEDCFLRENGNLFLMGNFDFFTGGILNSSDSDSDSDPEISGYDELDMINEFARLGIINANQVRSLGRLLL